MEKSDNKKEGKKKMSDTKTFPIPFPLEGLKENIYLNTKKNSKLSKDQIINDALKLHSEGNILEATKYYQYFIQQGFIDHKIFSNYGIILRNLGKLQEAKSLISKAIKINPNFAPAYFNMEVILNDLGLLQEAKMANQKGINLSFIQNIDSKYRKNCLNNLSLSRSQFKQDLFVLSELNFKKNGFFVEFGSFDGLIGSNSYMLEKFFDWNGILAEPSIFCHEKLKKNRSVIIETKCVWKESGQEILFNEPLSYKQNATINSFSDNNKELYKEGKKYKVKTISLLDLLDINNAPKFIDYLSIDTEGSEYEILNAFDFQKYKFRVISCEHNFTPIRDKVYKLLINKGYKRKFTKISRVDDWYVYNP